MYVALGEWKSFLQYYRMLGTIYSLFNVTNLDRTGILVVLKMNEAQVNRACVERELGILHIVNFAVPTRIPRGTTNCFRILLGIRKPFLLFK